MVEVEQSLTPHPTQYRSFRRRSSQPITWPILTMMMAAIGYTCCPLANATDLLMPVRWIRQQLWTALIRLELAKTTDSVILCKLQHHGLFAWFYFVSVYCVFSQWYGKHFGILMYFIRCFSFSVSFTSMAPYLRRNVPRRITCIELGLRRIVPTSSWRCRVGRAELASPNRWRQVVAFCLCPGFCLNKWIWIWRIPIPLQISLKNKTYLLFSDLIKISK